MQNRSQFAIYVLIALAVFSGIVGAQTSATPNDITLDAVETQAKTYVETFKNLLADETKTFELYGKNGEIKKRRVIKSTFLVFPLMKAEGQVVEFRNVSSVDNKKIDDSDKRAGDLISKLASVETSAKEINKLRDESSRYDIDLAISGLTLYQALVADKDLRQFFEFEIKPSVLAETPAISIKYRQTKDSPDITVNSRDQRPVDRVGLNFDIDSDKDQPETARLNGEIIVDASTFQVLSEVRTVTVRPVEANAPLTVIDERFEYQSSTFGILTPKQITHTHYRLRDRDMRSEKQLRVIFEYGNFSRPDVSVKGADVTPKN